MSENTLDVLGYWWLPQHREHKVPGRLTWDVEEGGRLELLGELHPLHLKDNHLPDGQVQRYRTPRTKLENQFPVIHGKEGRQAYTLLNSFSLNGVGLHDLEEQPENVAVNGVLHGAWYTDRDDIEADRAIFEIRHLTEWVDTTGLTTDFPLLRAIRDNTYVNITAKRLPAYTTSICTTGVELRQSLEFVGDQETASGVHNTWNLVTQAQPLGRLETFTDIATDVRALGRVGNRFGERPRPGLIHGCQTRDLGSDVGGA